MTSCEVSKATGLTLRQLQYLDEQQIIIAPRGRSVSHGRCRVDARLYSLAEFLQAQTVRALKRKGMSLQCIRRVLRQVAVGSRYLITDGKVLKQSTSLSGAMGHALKFESSVFIVEIPL